MDIQKLVGSSSVIELQMKVIEMQKLQQERDSQLQDVLDSKIQLFNNGLGPLEAMQASLSGIMEGLEKVFCGIESIDVQQRELRQELRTDKIKLRDAYRQKRKVEGILSYNGLVGALGALPPAEQAARLEEAREVFELINAGRASGLVEPATVERVNRCLLECISAQVNRFVYQHGADLQPLEYLGQLGLGAGHVCAIVARYLVHRLQDESQTAIATANELTELLMQLGEHVDLGVLLSREDVDTATEKFLRANEHKIEVEQLGGLLLLYKAPHRAVRARDDTFVRQIGRGLDELLGDVGPVGEGGRVLAFLGAAVARHMVSEGQAEATRLLSAELDELDASGPLPSRFSNHVMNLPAFAPAEACAVQDTLCHLEAPVLAGLERYGAAADRAIAHTALYDSVRHFLCRALPRRGCFRGNVFVATQFGFLYCAELFGHTAMGASIRGDQAEHIRNFIRAMRGGSIAGLAEAMASLHAEINYREPVPRSGVRPFVDELLEEQQLTFRTWFLERNAYSATMQHLFHLQVSNNAQEPAQSAFEALVGEIAEEELDSVLAQAGDAMGPGEILELCYLQIICQGFNIVLKLDLSGTFDFEAVQAEYER